jgi:uncharacterized protein (TIGR02646 family)
MIKIYKDYDRVPEILTSKDVQEKRKQALKEGYRHKFSTHYYDHETVRQKLEEIYHNKCAYCESAGSNSSLKVEHYRPKSKYYWLAYEWSNLLLICNACSVKKLDRFPVHGARVERPQDNRSEWRADSASLMAEKPLLLNPESDDPADHLVFLPDGSIAEKDGSVRGKETIEICDLNRRPLILARRAVIEKYRYEISHQMDILIHLLEKERVKTKGDFFKVLALRFDPVLKKIMDSCSPGNEYSSLGCSMKNEFRRFFVDDLPSDKRKKILIRAFEEFKKRGYQPPREEPDVVEIPRDIKGPALSIDSTAELSITIKKLRIKNFKGFKDREITFSDRFNLLLGDNGSGKTAVLDALVLVCGSILIGLDGERNVHRIKDEDVYQVSNLYDDEIRMEPNYAASVEAEGLVMERPVRWSKTRFDKKGQTLNDDSELTYITSKFQQPVRQGEHVTLPVIAYYGTGRLWLQTREQDIDPLPPVSRLYAYEDCLDPRSNERELIRWMKEQELAKSQGKKTSTYESVKKAVTDCIEEYKEIWFDFREDSIMVKLKNGQCLPANLFSDGYRNMLAMIADIAYRMSILNPHLGLEVAQKTPGIVLIDEIDLHLHPKWQCEVVKYLKQAFPKVQFIATSHSPFIVQSLREPAELIDLSGKIKLLENLDISIEDIVEEIMGVYMPQKSKRYKDMMEVAEKYYKLLEEGKSIEDDEELKKIKNHLDELLIPFSDDPGFQAFLKMERKAAKIDETG